MVKQYLGSWVILGLTFGLNLLNAWVIARKSEAPWGDSAATWLRRRRASAIIAAIVVNAFVAGAAVVSIRLLNMANLSVAILIGVSLFIVLANNHSRIWGAALMLGIAGIIVFHLNVPSALAAQMLWLVPLVALVGFLPRLMVALGSRGGRPAYWLMGVRLWVGLSIACAVVDTFFGLDSLVAIVVAWRLQLIQQPITMWFDASSLSPLDAVLYGHQVLSVGMLTPYALFGLLSALALWARKLDRPLLVILPTTTALVVWPLITTGQLLLEWRTSSFIPISTVFMLLAGLALYPFFYGTNVKDVLLNRHSDPVG